MKISFLMVDRYRLGGVVSATHNLAGALAARHEVEVVSLRRDRDTSPMPLDERVEVVDLTDVRVTSPVYDGDNPAMREQPKVYPGEPDEEVPHVSRLAELRLLAHLENTDADVVVSSNPRLTSVLHRAGRGQYLKVAQEHSRPTTFHRHIRDPLFAAYRSLDAVTVLTPEELAVLGGALGDGRNLTVMPNCVPPADGGTSTGRNRVVVTAGLLKRHKGFDDLIAAFCVAAEKHPDWQLRIYGEGPERAALRGRIEELGAYNQVLLMGAVSGVTRELAKGSVFALPSRREPFGNVVVEAMSCGLPVVATDCDHGPRNILTPGEDGELVPVGDVEAMAAALAALMEDEPRRIAMGAAAQRNAARFGPAAGADRFEEILRQASLRRARAVKAECRVTDCGSGDLHVTLPPVGQDGPPALVCLPAGGGEPVRIPFVPADGRLTAVVPRRGCLAEGEWRLSVEHGDAALTGVRADACDTRGLLSVPLPNAHGPALELLLPHVDRDGEVRVRSVVREVHAEVGPLTVSSESVRLTGELWGAVPAADAVVEAVHRGTPERNLAFAAQTGEGGAFRTEIPCRDLVADRAAAEDVWDLWLSPGGGRSPVRMCKDATDVLDPMAVFTFPRPVLEVPERRGPLQRRGSQRCELRPYYTARGQLALKVVDL
ncbi:glycosyltransferase [Streptomyces sp. 549]|uniref:glycosyltransferase n=1 Tax=Streptomyces sp. 549 TaxID=3049076 RepID=UPI0024C41512|nr:glycosyltransferase [Streptomyces sp. 549]MDK1473876.1 glycosyltransferase [Streptomyces sp. 549]